MFPFPCCVIRGGWVDRATDDACHPANVWQHCMFPDSRRVPSKTLEDVGTSPSSPADLRQVKAALRHTAGCMAIAVDGC